MSQPFHRMPEAMSFLLGCALIFCIDPLLAGEPEPGVAFGTRTYQTESAVVDTSTGDLDGDRVPDIAIAHRDPPRIAFLQGLGSLDFDLRAEDVGLMETPALVSIADLDQDGLGDLVVAQETQALVFRGTGGFMFSPGVSYPIGRFPKKILIEDLDLDGVPDLTVGCHEQGNLHVFLSDGVGGFAPPLILGSSSTGYDMDVGDMRSNGKPDLLVAHFDGAIYFEGDGQGGFEEFPIQTYYCQQAAFVANGLALTFIGRARSVSVHVYDVNLRSRGAVNNFYEDPWMDGADFDGDGISDLLVETDPGCSVLLAGGDPFFPTIKKREYLNCKSATSIADLDGDGLPEIIATQAKSVFVHENQTDFHLMARAGTVNLRSTPPRDVLFLNGSSGEGVERIVEYNILSRFTLEIDRPPAASPSTRIPYALYAWVCAPQARTARTLPYGIGTSAMPMPITGGAPLPRIRWNNTGRGDSLGNPTRSSRGAPEVLFDKPQGLLRYRPYIFIQGIIYDPGSAAAVPASVTNGIEAHAVVR